MQKLIASHSQSWLTRTKIHEYYCANLATSVPRFSNSINKWWILDTERIKKIKLQLPPNLTRHRIKDPHFLFKTFHKWWQCKSLHANLLPALISSVLKQYRSASMTVNVFLPLHVPWGSAHRYPLMLGHYTLLPCAFEPNKPIPGECNDCKMKYVFVLMTIIQFSPCNKDGRKPEDNYNHII